MPLDVQPLSPLRRAAMVGFMLALLAGSLGVASVLIKRQAGQLSVQVIFDRPPGALAAMISNNNLNDISDKPLHFCRVKIDTGIGRYAAFSFPDLSFGDTTPSEYLVALFQRTAAGDGAALPAPIQKTLARRPALEIEKQFGITADIPAETAPVALPSAFAIMRLANIDGHIVAICFSGPGTLAEADREAFDAYCNGSIHLIEQRGTPQRRP